MSNNTSINLPNKMTFTPHEVADILGVTVQTIYNWNREGKIKTIKLPGKPIRITRVTLISIFSESE